jgi:AcrR family transcriptional regulator
MTAQVTEGAFRTRLGGNRAKRILDVAEDLLLRWGYQRVTVEAIAQHASVGKGTVYLHWQTKDELFRAVLVRNVSELMDEVINRVRADPRTALLHRLLRTLFLAAIRSPLSRAVNIEDHDVLGRLASGTILDIRRFQVCALGTHPDYFTTLHEYGLLCADADHSAVRYALDAIITGFFRLERPALSTPRHDVPLERKADQLAQTARRTFEPHRHPDAATIQQAAHEVTSLHQQLLAEYRAELFASSTG